MNYKDFGKLIVESHPEKLKTSKFLDIARIMERVGISRVVFPITMYRKINDGGEFRFIPVIGQSRGYLTELHFYKDHPIAIVQKRMIYGTEEQKISLIESPYIDELRNVIIHKLAESQEPKIDITADEDVTVGLGE